MSQTPSQRPASAAPSANFSRAGSSYYRQQSQSNFKKSGLQMTASGRHPFGPAINAGPKSRPQTGMNPERTLHDPMQFWDTKMDKSAPFFRNTRV